MIPGTQEAPYSFTRIDCGPTMCHRADQTRTGGKSTVKEMWDGRGYLREQRKTLLIQQLFIGATCTRGWDTAVNE